MGVLAAAFAFGVVFAQLVPDGAPDDVVRAGSHEERQEAVQGQSEDHTDSVVHSLKATQRAVGEQDRAELWIARRRR